MNASVFSDSQGGTMKHPELKPVMQRIEERWERGQQETEPNYGMYVLVFMFVFWPVSMVLGLIDSFVIHDKDLRLINLALGLAAGGLAVLVYRARERQHQEEGTG